MAMLLTRATLPRAAAPALLLLTLALQGCFRDACNNECTAGTICDESLAACVPTDDGGTILCARDADCPNGRARCNAGGLCVQCLTTSDCGGGQTCNARTNTCLNGCTGPSDCAAVDGRHQCSLEGQCVECTTSAHCPALNGMHRTCDLGTNVCVLNPCQADVDCVGDPSGFGYCESGGCVQCHVSGDCVVPNLNHCTSDTHACVQCLENSDCNVVNGESCVSNTCQKTGCGTDADCAADQHCDTTAHACVACLQDADCNFGGTCQNKHCANPASCHADADCIYGTYCASGVCAACRATADCPNGQTCRQDGTCQQPSSCTRSDMCGSGQTCINGSCQVGVACLPDSYEANNVPQDATPLPTMASLALQATYCPNESDYFVVALTAGQGLQVKLQPTYASGSAATSSLSLDLVPGPGLAGQVVHGQTMRDGSVIATLEKMPVGGRVVLVRVAGNVDADTPYGLSAIVSSTALCGNDAREPDDGQTAASIVMPGSYQGTLCLHDRDWFAVDVPANERPVATLTSSAGAAEIGLAIYTLRNGNLTLDSYTLTDAAGTANVTAATIAGAGGQRYWIETLDPTDNGKESHYSLRVDLVANPPPNDACTQPNVLPANATSMGTTSGAVSDETASCGGTGGDAFWSFTVDASSRVEIDLVASFNAVLSLEGGCGGTNELACAGAFSETQKLTFEALPAGTWYVRVAGLNAASFGTYSLSTTVQSAQMPTNASCNLPINLNLTNGTTSVSGTVAGVDDGLPGCGRAGGEAVYAFTLDDAARIDARLAAFQGASLTLASATDCTTLAETECVAAGTDGVAVLSFYAVPAGSYVLIVDGGTAVSGAYALTVEKSAAIFPPENDTCDTATALTAGQATWSGDTRAAENNFTPLPTTYCQTSASAGDAVYHLAVTTPQEVAFSISADFDVLMELTHGVCGSAPAVDCQPGSGALIRQVLQPGDYYLWVDGHAGGAGTYTLSTSIQDAPPTPTNQTCATATTITAGTVSGSTATADPANALKPSNCRGAGTGALPLNGPNVIYALTIPAGQTATAALHPTDFDGALFVVDSCSASSCLAAADDSYDVGATEIVSVPNTGTSERVVYLVVGSWDPSAWGAFTLDVSLN